jgi:hypothetical protein
MDERGKVRLNLQHELSTVVVNATWDIARLNLMISSKIVSPITSKPASRGRIKTSHSEAWIS